jgi:cbb3-type cytochrome oxidase maturation protein
VRSGQYDDLDSPGQRILFEDDDHMVPKPDKEQDSDD